MKIQPNAEKAPTKIPISIRISAAALERFRATGDGWQTRMAAAIDRAADDLDAIVGKPKKRAKGRKGSQQ